MASLILLERPATKTDLKQAKEFCEKNGKRIEVLDNGFKLKIIPNEKTEIPNPLQNGNENT